MLQTSFITVLKSWLAAHSSDRRVAKLASSIVIVIGCAVLIGWGFNISVFKSPILGAATMKANTALCFILAGISLGLQTQKRVNARAVWLAQGCAIAVSAIGMLTLFQYLSGWDLGIDQLLFQDKPISPLTRFPGRMGDNTALNFSLVGLALFLRQERTRRINAMAETATLCAATIALLTVVGYAYNVQIFYQFVFYSTSMAIHTALTFLVLCSGILANAHYNLWRVLTGNLIGSSIARRLLPLAIAVPFVLGWVILYGLRANIYNATLSFSLLVVLLILTLAFIILKNAQRLNRLDYDRIRSSDRMRSSEERYRQLADNIPGVIYQYLMRSDGTDQLLYISSRSREIYEHEAAVLVEDFDVFWQMVHPDDTERIIAANNTSAQKLEQFDIEFRLLTPSGKLKWVQANSSPTRQPNGDTIWNGMVIDISDRKQAQLNEQFLNELDQQLRQLPDADAMQWETVSRLGEYFKVDCATWAKVDWENRLATIYRNWHSDGLSNHTGVYSISDFISPDLQAAQLAGEPVVIADIATHPDTAPYAARYQQLKIGAFINVPCILEGRWVATLHINVKTTRNWQDHEVALMQEIIARLWTIIEQTRTMQALREQEEQTRLATEAAKLGMWFWDITQNELIWTDRCKEMFGLASDLPMTYDIFLQALHPDDRDRAHAAVTRALEQQVEYDIEYRTLWSDGSIYWIAAKGRAFYNDNQQPIRMMGTAQDISDRKQTEATLQQQTKDLIQANRLKDEFLAALSHELRTPLNPILGWTKMLREQKLSVAKTAEALETIERNARQQIRLVDDLLDVSRVIQGKLNLEFSSVDLVTIIKRAIATVQLTAQAKGMAIILQGLPSLNAAVDGDRLQQVFWNLLSNAIKFTPDGGQITVNLSASLPSKSTPNSPLTGSTAQIQITDTGIGIAPNFLPHVFDHFRQADGSTTRKHGGLGLGLAIVRHLVELHGGTVSAESLGVGYGSTFTVKLPLQTEPADHPTSSISGTPSSLVETYPSSHPPEVVSTVLAGVRLLIVDDNLDNLDLLRFLLEEEGAIVTAVTSPLEAIELIAEHLPQCIISDIEMAELNGYDFIRQVRSISQGKHIPALALTAFAQREDQEKILSAGFQAYLSKPFDPIELLATLTQFFTTH
jgi:PAS domain S-box-containing protein